MDSNLVVTITGPDKIGLVERVSKLVVECHGNIAASRIIVMTVSRLTKGFPFRDLLQNAPPKTP